MHRVLKLINVPLKDSVRHDYRLVKPGMVENMLSQPAHSRLD